MPLVFVQRYAPLVAQAVGTQYVDGPLVIEGTFTVTLDAAVYNAPGLYILIDYTNGSFATPSQVSNIVLNPPAGRSVVSGPTVSGKTIVFQLS